MQENSVLFEMCNLGCLCYLYVVGRSDKLVIKCLFYFIHVPFSVYTLSEIINICAF